MTAVDVAVIGAGPAGLLAAWHAARRGHSVVVLERGAAVGGLAASFDVAGIRVDHGSHRLHPSTAPDLLAELRGLLGDDLQVRPRNGRIRLAGRWMGFPLSAPDLLRALPRRVAAAAAFDALVSPLRRPTEPDFAAVVRAGLGPTVSQLFYEPYAQKLWGVDPTELDGDLARRRVSANSPAAIARRLLAGARPEGRIFYAPRRGFGQIPEALADAAVGAGVDLRCGTEVVALSARPGGVVLSTSPTGTDPAAAGPAAVLEAATVWSTAPVTTLVRMLAGGGGADPALTGRAVAAAAGRLRSRAMVLAYLVLPRRQFTEFDAHYFPQADEPVARVSEPRNYRDDPTQPDDVTVLCAELPCEVGDATWCRPAAELGSVVADSLARLGLPGAEPVATEVRRVRHLYPVARRGYLADLAVVEAALAATPSVVTLGRGGLFTADNTHHALQMGAAAAAALRPDGSFDRRRWDASRGGFFGHVVED